MRRELWLTQLHSNQLRITAQLSVCFILCHIQHPKMANYNPVFLKITLLDLWTCAFFLCLHSYIICKVFFYFFKFSLCACLDESIRILTVCLFMFFALLAYILPVLDQNLLEKSLKLKLPK